MRYTLNLSSQAVEIISLGFSKLLAAREVVEAVNEVSAQVAAQNKAANENAVKSLVEADIAKRPKRKSKTTESAPPLAAVK